MRGNLHTDPYGFQAGKEGGVVDISKMELIF